MKLNIPPIGQRDPKWASKKLGNSKVLTISSDGCLLTCHSMFLKYIGYDQTPDILNEVYKGKGVFDVAMINFYAAGEVYPNFKAQEFYNCEDIPCDLSKIDGCLSKKLPVISYVDNVAGDGKPDHFVLIIGKSDDGHYIVNDPWTGEEYYFDAKWGDPITKIYGLRIYTATIEPTTEDKLSDLQDKIKSLNEQVAKLSLENNTLRTELETQEKDNEDLAGQLNTARTERDTATWEQKTLQIKIDELERGISSRDNAIDALKLDLVESHNKNIEGMTLWDIVKSLLRRK